MTSNIEHEKVTFSAESSYRQIERLIYSFCELVDAGDFAAASSLFDHGEFIGPTTSVKGPTMEEWMRKTIIVYDDGTPRTKHVITNLMIEVDERRNTASARSYITVFQQTKDLPLQAITACRYHDRFVIENGQWRFAERRILVDLQGDMSGHLRRRS